MPVGKTILLYTFDELSDDAKEKAREWWRQLENSSGDNFYAESVIEDASMIAQMMGFDIKTRPVKLMGGGTRYDPCIYWSGFSNQGDGACFEGSWAASDVKVGGVKEHAPQDEELHRIAGIFEDAASRLKGVSFRISHNGRYSHEYCTSFDFDFSDRKDDSGNLVATYNEALEETPLIKASRDFMNWIYRQLEAEYDHTMADEQVDESILINEYTFLEDGERYE